MMKPNICEIILLSLNLWKITMFTMGLKESWMKKLIILLFALGTFWSAQSCRELRYTYAMVAPASWSALLDLRDQATPPPHPEHTDTHSVFDFSESPSGILPFHFEASYINPDSMSFFLING